MYNYLISGSKKEYQVYANLINSPAGKYLSRNPYLLGLIREVVDGMKLHGPQVFIERDMGKIIGNTDIVETTEKDTIFFAQPHNKKVYSRYAKNRFPSPSQTLTIILRRDDEGNYEIYDTWIGPLTPPFPGDEAETRNSKTYWETHALANDAHSVQSKTITNVCPYV